MNEDYVKTMAVPHEIHNDYSRQQNALQDERLVFEEILFLALILIV